jgi:hypothetical protein
MQQKTRSPVQERAFSPFIGLQIRLVASHQRAMRRKQNKTQHRVQWGLLASSHEYCDFFYEQDIQVKKGGGAPEANAH